MTDSRVVLLKIMAMFLVMAVGWWARRQAYINAAAVRILSRLVVDLVFPCLVLTQMLRTVDAGALRHGWFVPLLGGGVMLTAMLAGWMVLPWFCPRQRLPTAVFLAGLPNWIFLPLPIAEALFGDAGVRDVLLFNVGAQLTLWSLGVWTLQGAAPNLRALINLARNPGLIATAAGIALALIWPAARNLETAGAMDVPPSLFAAAAATQALGMLGSLTIPLSLLLTGAQLGARAAEGAASPLRELAAVLAVRLICAPCLAAAGGWLLARLGFPIPEDARRTCYLIAAMPVAISASIMAERFNGDHLLSARAIFWSTVLSMLTVPAFYWLARHWGW